MVPALVRDPYQQRQHLLDLAHRMKVPVVSGDYFAAFIRYPGIQTADGFSIDSWIFNMLHELGHTELIIRRETHHIKAFKWDLDVRLGKCPQSDRFYYFYLFMEWAAWKQGYIIAVREGLDIDLHGYWEHAKRMYYTYVVNIRHTTARSIKANRRWRTAPKYSFLKSGVKRALQREMEHD